MRIKGSSWFLMIIMVVLLVVIIASLGMEYVDSKALPLVMASVAFVLTAIALWRDLSTAGKPRTTASGIDAATQDEKKVSGAKYLLTGAWVLGFLLGIYFLGFIVAIPLFVLSYMKTHGTGWLASVIATVLTPIVIYSVFQRALGVDLHPGILFTWLG